jgi:hypothetical protein
VEEVVMNVEQLRKQAKELVEAARAGDETALGRLGGRPVQLARAQHALAQERGYASWADLVHAQDAGVDTFVVSATSGRRERAERLLAARPEIARDRWAALVLGEGWDGDPNEVGGPLAWAPLHYVCHSCFAPVSLARELLQRGADPNAYFPNDYGPMSALYGAAGVRHDAELTRLLLEAAADPNGEPHVGDALYHSVDSESPDCTRLLLEYGAEPRRTNALPHALDYAAPARARRRPIARSGAPFDTPIAWGALGSQHWELPGRDYVAVVELVLAAGAELEPRFDEVAEGPLTAWLATRI